MLSLRSGSENTGEIYSHSFAFPIEDVSQVGEARRFASVLCTAARFNEVRLGRVAIVINELGNNLIKYAQGGKLVLRQFTWDGRAGIEILALDSGPGIENIGRVLEDGFSTGKTPGTGLGAVQRQADVFDIFSRQEKGTVIVAVIFSADVRASDVLSSYVISAISVPLKGESVCGDAWSVRETASELCVLVVDGLGHGPLAHAAAVTAVKAFDTVLHSSPDRQLQVIHENLKATRGAAVFILKINKDLEMDYCGVGNIRALAHGHENVRTLISNNGTAGVQIRTVKVLTHRWDGVGCLILHSDGIMSRSDLTQYPGLLQRHPAIVAAVIYRDFSRHNDDATVVVIGRRK